MLWIPNDVSDLDMLYCPTFCLNVGQRQKKKRHKAQQNHVFRFTQQNHKGCPGNLN